MKSHLRLQNLIFNTPQLVSEPMFAVVVRWADRVMQLNIVNAPSPKMMEDDDYRPQMATQAEQRRQQIVQDTGVDVIPVHGVLVPRSMHMDPCETMTSYEGLRSDLNRALADPSVAHIVFDIDSPGGSATGAFELADEIFAARAVKPITAVTNFNSFSGAYLMAAAATDIVVSQSSGVGSIGVIARHADISARNAADGIKVTTVYRGAHKNDLSPHEPLTDQSFQALQKMVDMSYEQFVSAVARYRGMTVDAVKGTEADVYFGQDAIDAGLADSIETPQGAVNRIASGVKAARPQPAGGRRIHHQAAAMALRNRM